MNEKTTAITKIFFKLGIKIALIIVGIIGISLTLSNGGFMGSLSSLLFFTIQSNITIVLITLIFLIADIIELKSGKTFINNQWLIVKFLFTVAITITFLVFFGLLAPTMPISYLASFSNLSVHMIVPLLALIDFFVYDHRIVLKRANPLFGIAMPLYYLAFALILSFSGVTFGGDAIVPYFFLDYEKFGWFSFKDGMGVFYWIIILMAAMTGLSFLMAYIAKVIDRKTKKKATE